MIENLWKITIIAENRADKGNQAFQRQRRDSFAW